MRLKYGKIQIKFLKNFSTRVRTSVDNFTDTVKISSRSDKNCSSSTVSRDEPTCSLRRSTQKAVYSKISARPFALNFQIFKVRFKKKKGFFF